MSLLNFNLSGVGLDISDLELKLVQLIPARRGRFKVLAWGSVPLKPGIIDEGLVTNRNQVIIALKKLKKNLHGTLMSDFVTVSLPETKTFLKIMRIEKTEESEVTVKGSKKKKEKSTHEALIRAIERELPKEIPLSLKQIVYDFQLTREDSVFWEVLIGAAPRDLVLEYTSLTKDAGLMPYAVEIEAQSIARAVFSSAHPSSVTTTSFDSSFIKRTFPSLYKLIHTKNEDTADKNNNALIARIQPRMVVDLGATRSSILVYQYDTIQMTRSLDISGEQITKQIAAVMKLSPTKAEQAKKICGSDPKKCKGKIAPSVAQWASGLVKEIRATIDYYINEEEGITDGFQDVVLCGGGAALVGLSEYLHSQLSLPVIVFEGHQRLEPSSQKGQTLFYKSVPSYTTAIGLAMRPV